MVINFSFGKEKRKEVISMIFIPIHLLEISITRKERALLRAKELLTGSFTFLYRINYKKTESRYRESLTDKKRI